MTDRELMQQALEALELECKGYADKVTRNLPLITSLRERLAQDDEKPVAWMHKSPAGFTYFRKKKQDAVFNPQPLYTASTRRQWVHLTNEEHEQIAVDCGCMSADWVFYGALVERKVKEKNA